MSDDHWFPRMSEVQEILAKDREYILNKLVEILKEYADRIKKLEGRIYKTGDEIDMDKLAKMITDLKMRIKFLEKKQEEQEEQDGRTEEG